jgi:hypothetical protein
VGELADQDMTEEECDKIVSWIANLSTFMPANRQLTRAVEAQLGAIPVHKKAAHEYALRMVLDDRENVGMNFQYCKEGSAEWKDTIAKVDYWDDAVGFVSRSCRSCNFEFKDRHHYTG